MLDLFVKVGQSNIELSVDNNLVPDGPNHQLDPYFVKLIVQSPTGLLGNECKSFMTTNPVPWSIHTERMEQ